MQNMSPDDTLSRLLHTWPCFKLVNAHMLASSRAQVRKGHVVSNETFKTHLPGITCFKALNRYWPCPRALKHVIPGKCDIIITKWRHKCSGISWLVWQEQGNLAAGLSKINSPN